MTGAGSRSGSLSTSAASAAFEFFSGPPLRSESRCPQGFGVERLRVLGSRVSKPSKPPKQQNPPIRGLKAWRLTRSRLLSSGVGFVELVAGSCATKLVEPPACSSLSWALSGTLIGIYSKQDGFPYYANHITDLREIVLSPYF